MNPAMDETPSAAPILVTGATGNVGAPVVRALVAAGATVRAADISVERVREVFGDQVQAVHFDFTDAQTWPDTFRDVRKMFLMRPPHISDIAKDMVPALEAAQAIGVQHMTFLSLQGAEGNKVVPHHKVEVWLRESGLSWTFVRASFFMQNMSGTHAADIRDTGEIIVPAGNGKTAFVDAEDVAAVAAVSLLEEGHGRRAYTPTGPAAMTYYDVARELSEVLGRPIRYTKPGIVGYALHASRNMKMPWAMVGVTVAIYTIARLGRADGLTDDVRRVTGRRPRTFREFAQAHRDVWTNS